MSQVVDFRYDVFISYSHSDIEWVRDELLRRLESSGLSCCLDFRDFEVGAPSIEEMERAVLMSRKTLLVLTPDYINSAWTGFEQLVLLNLDPANRQRRLIPVLRVNCDLPSRIRYFTYVSFLDSNQQELAWNRLLEAVRATVAPETKTPSRMVAPTEVGPREQLQSNYIREGLNALTQLLQLVPTRIAVKTFLAGFQDACERIATLGEYKYLHELFQQLEGHYSLIYHDYKRAEMDAMAWDRIERVLPGLRGTLNELLSFASQKSFAATEALWVQKLVSAGQELEQGIENTDPNQLKRAMRCLNEVLAREPSRLNSCLVAAAGSLPLQNLIKALTTIRGQLSELRFDDDKSRRLLDEFTRGVDALGKLSVSLGHFINDHDSLQDIDDELRRIEAQLNDMTGEIEYAWPYLKQKTQVMCDNNPNDWKKEFSLAGTTLEEMLTAKDEVLIRRAFRNYRSKESRSFNQVDRNLLASCGELQKIGGPLARLLGILEDE